MKICKTCGGAEFYANGGKCKVCVRARVSAYQKKNKEKVKAYFDAWSAANAEKIKANDRTRSAAYRAANPEKRKAIQLAYRTSSPEKAKASSKKWKMNNHDLVRDQWRRRRAATSGATGTLSRGLTAKLWDLQRGKCACCRQPLGDNYHLDHIMPLARGGSNTDDNMQLLRAICNLQKSAKHPVDFMQQRGMLL